MVRGTFSPARAWRLAVGPASTQTLARTRNARLCRVCAATPAPRRIKVECPSPVDSRLARPPNQTTDLRARCESPTREPRQQSWRQPSKHAGRAGGVYGPQESKSQSVVRASRGSAAPGSQSVVVPWCGTGNAWLHAGWRGHRIPRCSSHPGNRLRQARWSWPAPLAHTGPSGASQCGLTQR